MELQILNCYNFGYQCLASVDSVCCLSANNKEKEGRGGEKDDSRRDASGSSSNRLALSSSYLIHATVKKYMFPWWGFNLFLLDHLNFIDVNYFIAEIMNLRNLERVLAREEEVKKRAVVHKAVYNGPQIRYISRNGKLLLVSCQILGFIE